MDEIVCGATIAPDGSIPLFSFIGGTGKHEYMIRYQPGAKNPWIIFNMKEAKCFKTLKACMDFGIRNDWIPRWDKKHAMECIKLSYNINKFVYKF